MCFAYAKHAFLIAAKGQFIVVLDSANRENEGDLIIACEDLTTEKMAFMIRFTSGYICAACTSEHLESLDLPQMVTNNTDPNRTAYTISVDAYGPDITTGISAHNRALTCRTLASPSATTASFRRPGHVLPLKARQGGVRTRPGHTEAAIEFCRLAGKTQVAALCELIIDGEASHDKAELHGGGMMRRDECLEFARRWGLKACTIDDLKRYLDVEEGKLVVNGIN